MDLKYKNKEGITLQKVVDTLTNSNKLSKKEIASNIGAKKSIDTLIKKLIDNKIITKVTEGRSVFFSLTTQEDLESTKTSSKKNVDDINKATTSMSKDNTIIKLVEVEEKKVMQSEKKSDAVNQADLDFLKVELENISGKEVTAILHKRNEQKPKKKTQEASEIYEAIKDDEDIINQDNPYRFVLNFFTTTLNGELATGYFRRRDNYVVKSIYNKFKTVCDKIESYNTDQQHQPFYRTITINKNDLIVRIYHIDMNRMVRGSHEIFKLNQQDIRFIFGVKGEKNEY